MTLYFRSFSGLPLARVGVHLALFSFLLVASAACSKLEKTSNEVPEIQQSNTEIPVPRVDLRKPLEISESPADIALCERVNQTIDGSEFSKARWGVIVVGLKDGRVICGRDVQKLFNPASIHKLLTSVVALDKIGINSRLKTSVYAPEPIKGGAVEGDLILYGRGAPDLNDNSLLQLVRQLKQKGIKQVKGDIVGDESYFKGDKLGDGWTWNSAQWYYGAAASALSINRNQMTVSLKNGKPEADEKYVELSGEVKPIEDIEAIGVKRELGTNRVYVWGNGKNLNARIAVSDPALLSAKIFKELLERNGISVLGNAKTRDWKSGGNLDVEKSTEIASIESETLAETIRKMNKDSVNLYAELILRELGKKFGDQAPDEDPKMQKLRGDDRAGADVIAKWLKDNNIATEDIAIHDGSGLSRLDFVTPEAIGRTLVFAAGSKFAADFENSLPVAGQNGTLRSRLKNVSGKILAKTGSITYVNSLAGYARAGEETYAFAIISNNQTQKPDSTKTLDSVASILAGN